MIKVNLHGKLGGDLGQEWDLDVKSVAEAFRAIEANTKKLRKWLVTYLNEYEYEIFVNSYSLITESKKFDSLEDIRNSELFCELDNKIHTIDIIPKIIGSGAWGKVIGGTAGLAGAVLLGVFVPPAIPFAIALGVASVGLIAAGTSELLSKPPPSVPFTAQQVNPIQGEGGVAGGPTSYLFNGPVNTMGEGGPVPIGYGQLTIGGNNVFSSYNILYRTFLSSYSDATLQLDYQGLEQYLFNSKGYLITQTPLQSSPF